MLHIPRSTCYYEPKREQGFSELEERAMAEIDRIHVESPYWGARGLSKELRKLGIDLGRKPVARLMEHMGIRSLAPHRKTSAPAKHHVKFPYLLRGVAITHPNQVWATDITYIKLGRAHMYLSVVIDWYSRYVVSWRLHDTLEAHEAVLCMQDAFERHGTPAIANSDQGKTYTSDEYVELIARHGVRQSMDGRGRWADNVIVERWFRDLKHYKLFISEYSTPSELRALIAEWVDTYNNRKLHTSLEDCTPAEWYFSGLNAINSPKEAA